MHDKFSIYSTQSHGNIRSCCAVHSPLNKPHSRLNFWVFIFKFNLYHFLSPYILHILIQWEAGTTRCSRHYILYNRITIFRVWHLSGTSQIVLSYRINSHGFFFFVFWINYFRIGYSSVHIFMAEGDTCLFEYYLKKIVFKFYCTYKCILDIQLNFLNYHLSRVINPSDDFVTWKFLHQQTILSVNGSSSDTGLLKIILSSKLMWKVFGYVNKVASSTERFIFNAAKWHCAQNPTNNGS